MMASLDALPALVFFLIARGLDSARDVLALARVSKSLYLQVRDDVSYIVAPRIRESTLPGNLDVLLRAAYAATTFRTTGSIPPGFTVPELSTIPAFDVLVCAAHLAEQTCALASQANGGFRVCTGGFYDRLGHFGVRRPRERNGARVFEKTRICLQRCALVEGAARRWVAKADPLIRDMLLREPWELFLSRFLPDHDGSLHLNCEYVCINHFWLAEWDVATRYYRIREAGILDEDDLDEDSETEIRQPRPNH